MIHHPRGIKEIIGINSALVVEYLRLYAPLGPIIRQVLWVDKGHGK